MRDPYTAGHQLRVAELSGAMSSLRPYRPALEQLAKGRGITFDAAVVDACIRLCRDKGFRFSSPWGG